MEFELEYKGYHAAIRYDTDDNLFVGEIIRIEDLVCFHGSSIEEVKEKFEQSIDEYLKLCMEIGKVPDT